MSTTPRVILVFGLSGVGKSWLCSRYAAQTGTLHVTASALLRRAKEAASGKRFDSEALRTGAVLDNQQILVTEFRHLRESASQDIIFDGHNVIDTGEGLTFIPHTVIKDLSPNAIIFVSGDPEMICARREQDTSRTRPVRTIDVLSNHQNAAIRSAKDYATGLSISFFIVEAGKESDFSEAIESVS